MSIDDFENKVEKLQKEISVNTNKFSWSKIIIIVISIGLIFSIVYIFFNSITIDSEKVENKKTTTSKKLNSIQILSVKGNNVLLYKTDEINKKIILKNLETDKIIDITQSDMEVNTTILSNDGKNIIYSSNSENHTNLYMIMLNNSSIKKIFDSKNITYSFNIPCDKIENDYLKICKWTTMEWSSNNDKVSFFTCSKNMSFLTIVDTIQNSKPKILRDSMVCNNLKREHRWLKNEKIVFSSADCLYTIYPINDKPSKMIYGNISN